MLCFVGNYCADRPWLQRSHAGARAIQEDRTQPRITLHEHRPCQIGVARLVSTKKNMFGVYVNLPECIVATGMHVLSGVLKPHQPESVIDRIELTGTICRDAHIFPRVFGCVLATNKPT